jgi:hypothetical protein
MVVQFLLHKAHQILLKDLVMVKIHIVVDQFHHQLATNNHLGFLDPHHYRILLQPQLTKHKVDRFLLLAIHQVNSLNLITIGKTLLLLVN